MPTPATRTPVRIARGTYSNLNSSIADLQEGEICYATDQNKVYVIESATLTAPSYADLATAQTFTAGQRGEVTALTSASTVTIDMADSNNFSLTLGHNVTLANPSNLTAGQSGAVVITQASAGGPYTVSYGSYFKFPGGTVPTKTTTASSVCVLLYYVESSTRITAQLLNDVKV